MGVPSGFAAYAAGDPDGTRTDCPQAAHLVRHPTVKLSSSAIRGERYPAMIRPAVMGHHEMIELGAGAGPVFIEFACPALRQAPRPAAKQNDGPGLVICPELVGRRR